MKCVIPALNLKTFGKAIQSLAKIGDEISIEPTLDGLILKAVNATKSCMAFYDFKPRFFQHYDDGSPRPLDQNSSPRFRLTAKCCLNVFKSLNNMDKLVEHCKISLNEEQSRVVFALHCKHGIVKNYNLTYMEADPLHCSLSKGACSNVMKAESRLYSEIMASFPTSLAELTFIAKQKNLSVRNYVDGEQADPLKSFSTTVTLDPGEFELFQVKSETSISFCLKEVKAALMFAEFVGSLVSLYFDEAGKPMFINMDSDPTFEMTFIVSTISESLSQSSTASAASASTTVHNTSEIHDRTTSAPTPQINKTKPAGNNQRPLGKISTKSHAVKPPPPRRTRSGATPQPSTANHGHHSTVIQPNMSDIEVKPRLTSLMNDTSMTLLQPANHHSLTAKPDDIDALLQEIDNESRILEPEMKKVKSSFFNMKPTPKPQTNTQKYLNEILAEDSEDD